METKKITNLILGVSLAVLIFGSGYKIGQWNLNKTQIDKNNLNITNAVPKTDQAKNLDFSLYWDTWNKVTEKFIDKKKLDPQKMFYGSIKGLVSSLEDPYTFFMSPEENKQSKDDLNGKFEGIGAQLGLKDNRVIVIAPLKKSPAETAGVRAGDFIVKVDGESTGGWTLPKAVSKIRGPKGTKVTLTLSRGGKEMTFSIVRDLIKVDSVEVSYEKKLDCLKNCSQVADLKLNQFGETTNDEWDKAVNEIASKWASKQINGMVLDLRDNPGGFLDSSVYLASEFIPQGKLVVKQESTGVGNKDYLVDRKGRLLDIPLVVLINKGSASAAEILSGALRDYKRAELIGEKSFGKGSVQEALDLNRGAGLHVTVAKWILPNGDWINGKGIEPGVKIENKVSDGNTLGRQGDLQLEKAINEVLK